MQVHGIIRSISNPKQVTERLLARTFVVTIDHNKEYPQHIKFELHNDRCDLIESYEIDQEVSVDFNLRGREYDKEDETQNINTLLVWKIQPVNKR